ncbi:MAG: cobyrinate a,c-diamide synthase [Metallosphaera sp.]
MFPRIIISSDRSGSGKTLISSGLMMSLSKRFKVRGFKVGPDYIDLGYHKLATGSPSINLDLFIMGEEGVLRSLVKYSKGYDISVIEGVMGLYDGHNDEYSTFRLSEVTSTPIVLVIDCSAMGTTAAAVIHGLIHFGNAKIKGVIFNKISSEFHFNYCRSKVRDVKILGYIPRLSISVPSRHLGLFTVETNRRALDAIREISKSIDSNVDVDELINIASSAPDISINEQESLNERRDRERRKKTIAIAYDSAFSFYYQESLDLLSRNFDLKFFSPINNEKVEGADMIYLGGGYPELFVKELSSSLDTIKWIKNSVSSNVPLLAECGGLMYLSTYIRTQEGKFNMANLYDIGIGLGRLTIGYRYADALKDTFLAKAGDTIRGHEFHVSSPEYVNEKDFVLKHRNGKGINNGLDGVKINNSIASYLHVHLASLRGLSL